MFPPASPLGERVRVQNDNARLNQYRGRPQHFRPLVAFKALLGGWRQERREDRSQALAGQCLSTTAKS